MARKLDKIVVVDLEATCWEGNVPDGMESDIIEIGVCLLDVSNGDITDNRGILVKPEQSTVSTFCTELTTITQEMIDAQAITFKEACKVLKKEYDAQGRAWASYGAYDHKQFQRQCTALNIAYPFGPSHLNVKTLFALRHKLQQEVGMPAALSHLSLSLEGTHHRGVDDARNIAKILFRTLNP